MNLSRLFAPHISHSALVLHAPDDAGQPRKAAGDSKVTSSLTTAVLESVRGRVKPGTARRLEVRVAGGLIPVLGAVSNTGAVLALANPGSQDFDIAVVSLWQIVALRIQAFAQQASPAYLIESRAVASVRVEAVAELADQYSSTLESLLAVLRSPSLDDHASRQAGVSLATEAVIDLRTATDRVRTAAEEPVTQAFTRLRNDLLPLLRYRDVNVQFVEPPVDGRALPSEIAHGARAVVRGTIRAFVEQPDVTRVRVQWDCDGRNLLIDIRDDGTLGLSADHEDVQPIAQRVAALNGSMTIDTTEGWGSEMSVVLPLDPPKAQSDVFASWGLAPREIEVLHRIATGMRNRAIAGDLNISENTVKFHVSNIFRKLGVTSRSEAAALIVRRSRSSM